MRFLMATSFFPPHHFGGDAVYVRQLVDALRQRGHEADVVCCYDAYRISGGQVDLEAAEEDDTVVRLASPFGKLSPVITHLTGDPGLKRAALRSIFERDYDVVHFHNVSLIGGPGVLPMSRAPLTLFTAHEHWSVCPTHIFWKNQSKACDKKECFSCQIRSGRPPQLWRYTSLAANAFKSVDHIFAPSAFTKGALEEGGILRPMSILRLFAPKAYEQVALDSPELQPTFLFVGRVTKSKGVAELVRLFAQRPAYRLQIVGDGDLLEELRESSKDMTNVEFLGRQSRAQLPALYRRATAVILPSLAPESFGLATIEGFTQGTPAIVRDAGGAGEVIRETGAGFVYKTDAEALAAIDKLATDADCRSRLGAIARESFLRLYTEERHVDAYMAHIADMLQQQGGAPKL
jgi:glycosyltransferase involved in cell wall biosynthesis